MRLALPAAFLQASLLNPSHKYIEMHLDLPDKSFKIPYEVLILNIWKMHLDLPGPFLQASLLVNYYTYIRMPAIKIDTRFPHQSPLLHLDHHFVDLPVL